MHHHRYYLSGETSGFNLALCEAVCCKALKLDFWFPILYCKVVKAFTFGIPMIQLYKQGITVIFKSSLIAREKHLSTLCFILCHCSVDDLTNPVGKLQELVTRLGLRRPQYEADVETGPAHDRRFIISVTVGEYTKQGWSSVNKFLPLLVCYLLKVKIVGNEIHQLSDHRFYNK